MSPQPQTNTSPNELEAAFDYARQHIPVFPTNPLDKKPLTVNGFKDATTDETQIREWWQRWPNAMIAAPTGAASGMWVIDLDVDSTKNIDGMATLTQLVAQQGEILKTLMTITPRGGRHLIFAWNPNNTIRNSAGKIGPGIDVRGEGGYVCLPPSRNANGGIYRWDPDGATQAVAAPAWLVELARSKPPRDKAWARAALERECKAVASAQSGTRNSALNAAAFNLFQIVAGGGLDEQEVRDQLFQAAQACGLVNDDGAASVWATIDSAAQAAHAQPRTRPALSQRQPKPQAQPQPQPQSQSQPQPQAQPQPQPQPQPRPVIKIVAGQVPRIIDETEQALIASGAPIFKRAGLLVEPVSEIVAAADGRKTVMARLRPLCPDSLLEPIAEAAVFQRFHQQRNAWVEIDPPIRFVRMMLARERQWKLPRVNGVITTPTLRADGSLLADPGYDPSSELYLLPGLQLPPIPERPTREQAQTALALLIELFSEFSFQDKKVDQAVALAGLLTAQVRGSLPTAPVFLIRADTAGTGKSYLVDVISMITTGWLCPVITTSKNAEETEKRIGSVLLDGTPIVSLDNCTHDLGGELLCQLSERPVIKIRILGRSEMPKCECRTAVFATGNNVVFKGDMIRRGLVCNLETLMERPELREFQHDALKQAMDNRGTYVAAALIIIRAYLAAGSPRVCGPLGSYEAWSTMVRGPLVWLGESDPVASMESMRVEDPELADIREFFDLWIDYDFGLDHFYTTNRIIEIACTPPASNNYNLPAFKQMLLRVAADQNGASVSAKRLGWWLRKISGRVVNGYRLLKKNTDRSHFSLTKVE